MVYHYPINDSLHKSIFSRSVNEVPIIITELQKLKPQMPEQLQNNLADLIDLLSDVRIYEVECFCD